jgi:hypothetical protein
MTAEKLNMAGKKIDDNLYDIGTEVYYKKKWRALCRSALQKRASGICSKFRIACEAANQQTNAGDLFQPEREPPILVSRSCWLELLRPSAQQCHARKARGARPRPRAHCHNRFTQRQEVGRAAPRAQRARRVITLTSSAPLNLAAAAPLPPLQRPRASN